MAQMLIPVAAGDQKQRGKHEMGGGGVFEFSGGEVVARPVMGRPNPAATGAGVAGSGGGQRPKAVTTPVTRWG
jgi:hypothetical protein